MFLKDLPHTEEESPGHAQLPCCGFTGSPAPIAARPGGSLACAHLQALEQLTALTFSEPPGRKSRSFFSAVHIWPGVCAKGH